MDRDSRLRRIANGRTDLAWDHLAGGGSAAAHTADGVTLLQWCAYFGDVTAVRLLLSRGESLASLGSNLGLHGAAFHGHWRLCEFLLEQGADVDATEGDTGETPLHAALCTPRRLAHDLVVRVLLAHGADPRRATRPGVDTGCFMRDCRTKGETPLHRAAAFGSEETIDLLLDAGADTEALDAHGDTPLAWASWHARPDAILRRLCYGPFRIRPDRQPMHVALLGTPLTSEAPDRHGDDDGSEWAGGTGADDDPARRRGEPAWCRQAIPVLHVSSSVSAQDFYCRQLGFHLESANRADESLSDPCYMAVARDGATLHLSSFAGDAVAGGVAYVVVSDVDALHDEFVARGVPIDTGPVDQTWGTREMYVKDADRNSIRFVQERRASR